MTAIRLTCLDIVIVGNDATLSRIYDEMTMSSMSSQTVSDLATRMATDIRELQCRRLRGAEDGM